MISQIKNFPDYYVSENGQVFSSKKNGGYFRPLTMMKLKEDKDGYFEVGLYLNGKRYFRRVHRLVAEAFLPNPNHYPQINHKDGNRQNNNVSNLEWCTCQENIIHSFETLHRNPTISMFKPLKLTDKERNQMLFFNTIKDCAFYLNMSYEHLGRLLNGKLDMSKWRKGKRYNVEYCDIEDVTTIPQGSTDECNSHSGSTEPSHER